MTTTAESTPPTPPPPAAPASRPDPASVLLIASALGALSFAIVDRLNNGDAALLQKLATMIRVSVLLPLGVHHDELLLALTGIALAGAAAAWLKMPRDRTEAFTRGFALFASLTVAAPFVPAGTVNAGDDNQVVLPGGSGSSPSSSSLSLFGTAWAATAGSTGSAVVRIAFAEATAPPPEADVTVLRHDDGRRSRIALEGRQSLILTAPPGRYEVDVRAPDYREVRFAVILDTPPNHYDVEVPKAVLPDWLQRFRAPLRLHPEPSPPPAG